MIPVQLAVKRGSKENIGHTPAIPCSGHQESALYRFGRLCDRVAGLVLLIVTGPLIAFAALAVKLETRGPVFDRSECLFRGRRFTSLKLRTRVHDPLRPKWSRELTKVGNFLEHARIDTLPQLVNVLRGEMSLIDSRSASPEFLD